MSSFLIYTIDDDMNFNMVLKTALKPYGIEVKTYLSPAEFTASVKDKLPDLCILDLNLSNAGEGFQLLKAMRNVIGNSLPIFIMSKRGERDDVFKAMEMGATDFIPKPLDDKYLLLKLKDYIHDSVEIDKLEHSQIIIPEVDQEAIIKADFQLVKVGLEKIDIKSDVFLAKESHISLKGEIIKNIFGSSPLNFKVTDSSQLNDVEFRAELERDLNENEIFSLRKWLSNNQES